MDSPAARQLLKVLSGPHAGGEVLLADGDYTLGSDDASEIVLVDSAIAPRHAEISIRSGRVQCRTLDGARILLDGVAADGAQLAAFQCFTLGNTHLAIGPADGKWPSIELPKSQTPEPLPAAAEAAEAEPNTAEAEPEASDPPPAASLPAPTTATVVAVPASTSRRAAWGALAAAALLIVGFLAVVSWWSGPSAQSLPAPSREERQATLKIALDKLGFGDTVAVSDKNGKFTISGHVPTPADKKSIREAIQALDRTARIRVYDATALVTSVADALRMYKLDFTATAGAPGEVVVQGVLKDVPQWTKVRQRIITDMPQLAALTERFSNVARAEDPGSESEPETAPADPPAPAASGSAAAIAASQTPAAAPAAWLGPSLPPIHSVSVGNYQALTLTNGEHIYRGAVLESGYTVTEITSDRVVLTRDGRQHIIKIGI